MAVHSQSRITQPGQAVHFGAGALGRGLVVPRLVEAGWRVQVVDPVGDLVEALAARSAYDLVVVEGAEEHRQSIAIDGALHSGRDAERVLDAVAGASLITTAVRKENLPGVMDTVRRAWAAKGRRDDVAILGCENVEHVDVLIREYIGDDEAIRIPATVVDRICAGSWPQGLDIRTEAYTELAVQRQDGRARLAGVTEVANIDAFFDRKRYLVNTLADASAILGLDRGMQYLSEAIGDSRIQTALAPLMSALLRHLEVRHDFVGDELERYLETSRKRLSNTGIPRRLDTVARDITRKLTPGERFSAPLLDLRARGEDVSAATEVLARLAVAGLALERPSLAAATAVEQVRALVSSERDENCALLYADLAARMAALDAPEQPGFRA